jgi:hypothetical protein
MNPTEKADKIKCFKVGDIWLDIAFDDQYLITAVDRKTITGVFLETGVYFNQLKKFCNEDRYVRKITKLEWELYDTDSDLDIF